MPPSKAHFAIVNDRITFRTTDGDDSRWPDSTTRVVSPDGNVNYLAKADDAAPALVRLWKKKIATFLIRESGMIHSGEFTSSLVLFLETLYTPNQSNYIRLMCFEWLSVEHR